MSDPLDDLLRPETTASTPAWKNALRDRTAKILRRRRHARRTAFVGALAACFVGGILAAHLFRSEPPIVHDIQYVYMPAESKPDKPVQPTEQPEPKLTALALEWQAVESPDRSAELYRRAGDRYFEEENDVASALRCYRHFLRECHASELGIAPQDNWLLVNLKNAQREERRHAKSNG
jgi:hypothetical protein